METMIELTCETCGTKFKRRVAEVNRNNKKGLSVFCNNRCQAKHPKQKDEFSDFRMYINYAKRNANNKNFEFNIDLKYLRRIWNKQNGICPLTGWNLIIKSYSNKSDKLQIYHASLDRIDSKKGYIKGNVRFISIMANYAKHRWNDEEVIEFCKAVADNN